MKKLIAILVAAIMVSILVAAPVFAGGNGAVKMDLKEWDSSTHTYADPVFVGGWAIVNTTLDGELIVQVHMDERAFNDFYYNYGVRVKVRPEPGPWHSTDVGMLSRNVRGKGNAHFVVDIPSGCTGNIEVRVAIRTADNTTALYVTDITQIPLKDDT